MALPEKFTKYPWITGVVIVTLVLLLLYGLVDLFGPDRVAAWIEGIFSSVGVAAEGGKG